MNQYKETSSRFSNDIKRDIPYIRTVKFLQHPYTFSGMVEFYVKGYRVQFEFIGMDEYDMIRTGDYNSADYSFIYEKIKAHFENSIELKQYIRKCKINELFSDR